MTARRSGKPEPKGRGSEPVATVELIEAAELRRRLRVFLAHGDTIVRRHGLTPQRYLLLLAIKGAPDGSGSRSIGELADDLQLAQSSITELVDRVEAAGLVIRTSVKSDARVVRVRLTPLGDRRLRRAFAAMRGERVHLPAHLEDATRHLMKPA